MKGVRHGKRDLTHKAIVAELRCLGASVFDLGDVGNGCPDLLVGLAGRSHLVECKTGKGKLRESQKDFQAAWTGGPVAVIRSPSEAALWLLEQRRKAAA